MPYDCSRSGSSAPKLGNSCCYKILAYRSRNVINNLPTYFARISGAARSLCSYPTRDLRWRINARVKLPRPQRSSPSPAGAISGPDSPLASGGPVARASRCLASLANRATPEPTPPTNGSPAPASRASTPNPAAAPAARPRSPPERDRPGSQPARSLGHCGPAPPSLGDG